MLCSSYSCLISYSHSIWSCLHLQIWHPPLTASSVSLNAQSRWYRGTPKSARLRQGKSTAQATISNMLAYMRKEGQHTLPQDPHVLPPFAIPAPHLGQVLSWALTRTVVDCMVADFSLTTVLYVCRYTFCSLLEGEYLWSLS